MNLRLESMPHGTELAVAIARYCEHRDAMTETERAVILGAIKSLSTFIIHQTEEFDPCRPIT